MATLLSEEESDCLGEIIRRRQPELLQVVEALGKSPLSTEHREALRGALADELCETGLLPDGEPNRRGLQIDDLIGRLAGF